MHFDSELEIKDYDDGNRTDFEQIKKSESGNRP